MPATVPATASRPIDGRSLRTNEPTVGTLDALDEEEPIELNEESERGDSALTCGTGPETEAGRPLVA